LRLITGYVGLDIIKTIGALDPYFWGYVEHPGPSYLPDRILSRPGLVTGYRLLIAQISIYLAVKTIVCLRPLYYVGLRGSAAVGVRGEGWMYPDDFGSYFAVLEKGLAGWWGVWWHQIFRFVFEAPSKYFRLDAQKTAQARILRLFVAFGCSGFLHACGSHTAIGNSNPVAPLLFFLLQPLGIMAQLAWIKLLRYFGISAFVPKYVAWTANVIFVHLWFYFTAPMFIADVAVGGQFLFEPVPFSIVRALGFGGKDMSWFCWQGRGFLWYEGRRWWQSGIIS
jgi:hypothetical protein